MVNLKKLETVVEQTSCWIFWAKSAEYKNYKRRYNKRENKYAGELGEREIERDRTLGT